MAESDRSSKLPSAATSAPEMVFVVGNSRSGTTMMGRILAGHPEIFTFHELHFFEELWDPGQRASSISAERAADLFARLISIQREGYFRQGDSEHYLPEARQALASGGTPASGADVYRLFLMHETAIHDRKIACDHTPRNVYYLEDILGLFPGAFVVQMVRDPRDVLLSQKNKWKRRFLGGEQIPYWEALRAWANYHPITMSLLWRSGVEAGARWESHPRVTTVLFEELLRDPEHQVQAVCRALGIDFVPDMLKVPQVGSSLGRDRPQERGINPDVTQRWKQGGLLPAELVLSQRITRKSMRRYGYASEPARASILAIGWLVITFAMKAGLAFLLNVRRMRNPLHAIYRRSGLG
jgi:hypothetical protein